MTIAPGEDRRLAGIGLMLLAFLTFTGIDTSAKWLVQAGLPPREVVFLRFAIHLAIAVAIMLPRDGTRLFSTNAPRLELVRGLFLAGSTFFNFFALKYLALTVTVSIFFASPLAICALSVPLLGEKVGLRRWSAIGVGFLGVLIVTRPWSASFHWAMILSLAALCCAAMYFVMTRKLAGIDRANTQQLYASLIATTVAAPAALFGWTWPSAAVDWLALAVLGVCGWGGHQLAIAAHRLAPASTLAPFVYVQIVYMTASSWFIFHTAPDIWVLAGAAVVMGAGLYVWLRERQLSRPGNGD